MWLFLILAISLLGLNWFSKWKLHGPPFDGHYWKWIPIMGLVCLAVFFLASPAREFRKATFTKGEQVSASLLAEGLEDLDTTATVTYSGNMLTDAGRVLVQLDIEVTPETTCTKTETGTIWFWGETILTCSTNGLVKEYHIPKEQAISVGIGRIWVRTDVSVWTLFQ